MSTAVLLDIAACQKQINRILKAFFVVRTAEAAQIDANYEQLWRATQKLVLAGGKRLRPYLCLLAYQAYGGPESQHKALLRIAAAQELLHASLLVHDDIIDRDYTRYGIDNIAGQYRAIYQSPTLPVSERDHYANSSALLAGDLLLSSAHMLIAESGLPAKQIIAAQKYLNQALFTVGGGELLDTESALRPIEGVDTTKIAELKTAAYSFIAPLCTGAFLAGADAFQSKLLAEYGRCLGIAYQLADDILGAFGDPEVTGKPSGGDLKEAKRTYLLQTTYSLAKPADRQFLARTIGARQVGPREEARIKKIMVSTGGLAATQKKAEEYAGQAARLVSKLDINPSAQEQLKNLTQKAINTSQRTVSSLG